MNFDRLYYNKKKKYLSWDRLHYENNQYKRYDDPKENVSDFISE